MALHHPAVQHNPRAQACAQGEQHQVLQAPARPKEPLAVEVHPHVVVDEHRQAQALPQPGGHGHVLPLGEVGGKPGDARLDVQQAGHAHAHAEHPLPGRLPEQLLQGRQHPAQHVLPAALHLGGQALLPHLFIGSQPVGRRLDVGAAQVHAQYVVFPLLHPLSLLCFLGRLLQKRVVEKGPHLPPRWRIH